MQRIFNTTGICRPDSHYMVRLDDRMKQIKEQYIDKGSYFVINCARQYGKTTTLRALENFLKDEYLVLSMDFQEFDTEDFRDSRTFSKAFSEVLFEILEYAEPENGDKLAASFTNLTADQDKASLRELFNALSRLCKEATKPVVLMIDEIDSASNNQVFIDFLSLLRKYYLSRDKKAAFHSVILAGVYDIKNLKLKIRPDEEHQYNSPWNIATQFHVRMSFSVKQIVSMLAEYEKDKQTGMEVIKIAQYIYDYTSGYPYLISAICKLIDEELPKTERFKKLEMAWTEEGVRAAVKIILSEPTPLFGSMVRQLSEYPDIKKMLKEILFQGKKVSFNTDSKEINLASMLGYIVNKEGSIQVSNRIFEMRLYNLFLSEEELTNALYDRSQGSLHRFIRDGQLDMDKVVEKFVEYFHEIYQGNNERFIEENGRRLFLLYLKPIINGIGNYYIEAQTRDARRTDVIVDYLGEQFIIELKIWRGNEYKERGEKQLTDYLEYYHKEKGYLISFNFNKNKKPSVTHIKIGEKTIVEAVV